MQQRSERTVIWGLLAGAATVLWTLGGCASSGVQDVDETAGRPLERFEFSTPAMGVEARIVLYANSQGSAESASEAAFERIEEVERALSSWRSDSELFALVQAAGEPARRVGDDLSLALARALDVSRATQGAYDPTGAPVFGLWRAARESGSAPSAVELDRALQRVGRERVQFESAGVRLEPGTDLDLGGLGKGFACDAALRTLMRSGHAQALVELGGDLALGDPPPGARGWNIAAGSGAAGAADRRLTLANCGVATSGDRWQGLDTDRGRLSHVIDPRSGRAVDHGATVTVVAEDAALADGLATAASVLGPARAPSVVELFDAQVFVQPAPAAAGSEAGEWITLFDGASLAGWTDRGGRYDGNARWSVEHGAIVGQPGPAGEGGLLYTEAPFASFEIEFETWLDYPFDSGLFARMLPPDSGLKGMQVTLDHREGGEIAGLYADGWVQHNPGGEALFVRGEWNHVRVACTGFELRTRVWINGTPTLDHQLGADASGFASQGLIGLQVHPVDASLADQRARFRAIRVRELPMLGEEFAENSADLLEDGLAAWTPRGSAEGYAIADGVLSIPAQGTGELMSVEDYADFRLSLEFRINEMANSGVYLRSSRTGANASYAGWEVQILDDFNWERVTDSELVDYQFTGGLYGAAAPLAGKRYFPPGEWNRMEILARGPRLAAALNGRLLWDLDASALEVEPAYAERPAAGFIGFQRYGAPDTVGDDALELRAVRVERLE